MLNASRSRTDRSVRGALTSRFGRRMVLLFSLCALLPLVVFAAVAATRVSDQLRQEVQASLHKDAKMAGQSVAARLTQVAGDLSLAVELVQRWRSEGVWSDGQALQRQIGARCQSMLLVEGERVTALCGGAGGARPRLGERELQHLGKGLPLLRVMSDPAGRVTMSMAVDPADPAALLVTATIDGRFLWRPEELRGPTCEVFVCDVFHRLLFHSSQTPPSMIDFAAATFSSSSSGGFEWEVDGEPHLARYWRAFMLPKYDFDLLLVQSRSAEQAFATARSFLSSFATIDLATLLVVLLASLVQIRHTLVPVMQLRAAAERLGAGDLDIRVAIDSDDEFGQLGTTFNDMAQGLQENVQRRERTEQDLVASRDAALAAARAKHEFVTNVSHEFRTPMAEILGAAEILGQLGHDDLTAREEFIGIALHGAQRLARLLEDVLELGGLRELQMAPVDVEASLRSAVERLGATVGPRVQIDCAEGLPRITAEAEELDKVWDRLLDNAVKFSAGDSPIVLRAFAVEQRIVVEVVDRGFGIAEADLGRVFEPFQQVGRDQLTDKASGTGLGLSLVRSTIEGLGGSISVSSCLGSGTTFQLRFPIALAGVAKVAMAAT